MKTRILVLIMVLQAAFTVVIHAQDVTICNDKDFTIRSLTSAFNGTAGGYRWYENNVLVSTTHTSNTSYTIKAGQTAGTYQYVRQAYAADCKLWRSGNSFVVQVIAGTTPGVPSATGTARCGSGAVTCTATAPTGGSITWWTAATGGTQITFPRSINSTTTFYAQAHSGANGTGCISASRRAATATVNPTSVGGAVNGSKTITAGSSAGTLSLSGHTGAVQRWQSSTNGTSWTNISNTATSLSPGSPATTTYYRAVVKSSVCSEANSTPATVTVNAASAGGTIAGSKTICAGSSAGTLSLSGHTGAIQRWQSSTNGTNWTNISSTTTSYSPGSPSTTTYYRAVVKNGVSAEINSVPATVTVRTPATAPTSISASANNTAPGTAVTLTASGGGNGSGAVYEWGTGSTVGSNKISPATTTAATRSVSPTATTTYWVRRISNTTCTNTTSGVTTTVTVTCHAPGTATMQNFYPCSNAATNSTWNLTDTRNNVTYKVRKLADGRYWMVDDLKYPAACNKTSFSGSTQSTGTLGSKVSGFYGDCHNITDASTPANRGYHYDWMFVMQHANAYNGSSWNPGCTGNPSDKAACRGICPEGWHVPTGNESTGEFTLLNNAVNSGSTSSPSGLRDISTFNGVYGGDSYPGNPVVSLYDQGLSSNYWSSSYLDTSDAYNLGFDGTGVLPSRSYFKNGGFSVRCIRNY